MTKGDRDDAYFTIVTEREPFRRGHKMKVVGIEREDEKFPLVRYPAEGLSKMK